MVKQSFLLDPNAQAYTDDEIVAKINAAAAAISRADAIDGAALGDVDLDDIGDSATRVAMSDTEQTKLGGVAEGAEVNVGEEYTSGEQTKLSGIAAGAQPDQTGPEVRDLIVAIPEVDRKIVITDPQSGEFKILAIQRDADGKTRGEYDDVAIP